jgi:hypothetical protein
MESRLGSISYRVGFRVNKVGLFPRFPFLKKSPGVIFLDALKQSSRFFLQKQVVVILFSFQEAPKAFGKAYCFVLKYLESHDKLMIKILKDYRKECEKLMSVLKRNGDQPQRRRPPATTPEARENQLIAAAVDLAEKQILKGTASSQVITHYLKLGSTKERLEKEILEKQKDLLQAKTEAIQSAKKVEELYANALNAMRSYSGRGGADEDD